MPPIMCETLSQRILELSAQATTLRVSIPPRAKYAPRSPDIFVFNRVNTIASASSSSVEKEICVFVHRIISETDHSTVYLGVLDRVRVVLKCCYNTEFYKDFKREAKVYETRLGDLQGDIVPTFYGYYRAVDEQYGPYSLLLLEHCGKSIPWLFRDLPVNFRVDILNLVGKFHTKSRLHLIDFAERNVVCCGGRFRLIDFHDIEGHRCKWTEDVDWQAGEYDMKARDNFPCGELADLGDEMNIWYPFERPMVSLLGKFFPASEFPPQEIVDKLVPPNFIGCAPNWAWIEAYMKDMKQLMESGIFDVTEQIAKRPLPPLHP